MFNAGLQICLRWVRSGGSPSYRIRVVLRGWVVPEIRTCQALPAAASEPCEKRCKAALPGRWLLERDRLTRQRLDWIIVRVAACQPCRPPIMKLLARSAKAVILIAIVVAAVYVIDSREANGPGGLVAPAQRRVLRNLTLRNLEGQVWRLSDDRGKVVLVNYWATWCPPCREELPDLVQLANSYSHGELDVLGISMDDGREATVRRFVSEYKIPYTIAMPGDNFPLSSAVEAIPTTVLIDKQGRVAKTYVGAARGRVFRADIDALLHE